MNVKDLGTCTLPLFATPVVNYRIAGEKNLNIRLRALILELEKTSAGVVKSNVGGWHSPPDFLQNNDPSVQELGLRLGEISLALVNQFFHEAARITAASLRLEGWANILRYGQYNTLHCHPNALWSGVYFATDNERLSQHPMSGKLELLDPRPGASFNYDERSNLYGRFLVNPTAGQVIIFPAWLQHQVHPYFGDTERISIAFNVMVA